MDFEIKDLEIIDSQPMTIQTSFAQDQTLIQNSAILKELHAENEELQAKIKLNHRRLLLFETENNKLVEEKNKYFFESQNFLQKNQILVEKNEELTVLNKKTEGSQKLLIEKLTSFQNINETQLNEIKRFSKFHSKIQEVVKPLVTKLKIQITELRSELHRSQKLNSHLSGSLHDLKKTTELELQAKDHRIGQLTFETNSIVKTYEEQIHSFSKEILHLQNLNEETEKEISRLKKVTEFKNYFENEVIRFKRSHEIDQQNIRDLSQKTAQASTLLMQNEQLLLEARTELSQLKSTQSGTASSLEVTRQQLSRKIDELTTCFERISRLEKLNTQLSLEISSK